MSSESQLHARRLLLLQFSSRLPVRSLAFQWPNHNELLSIQSTILKDLGLSRDLDEAESTQQTENGGGSGSKVRRRATDQQYERAFFKALISRLEEAVESRNREISEVEDDEQEVDGSILEYYTSLLSSTSTQLETDSCPVQALAPQPSYITHYYPCTSKGKSNQGGIMNGFQSAILREEGASISRGTTGLKTWEASLRLAAHLLTDPSIIVSPNSRVLELGSGVGLLGVVCSQLQSDHRAEQKSSSRDEMPEIWLSDVEGAVVDRLEETLQLNDLASDPNVHLVALNWIEVQEATSQPPSSSNPTSSAESISILEEISPTLIIAADVVFSPELLSPLCCTLKTALQMGRRKLSVEDQDPAKSSEVNEKRQPKALIASTIRNQETYGQFLELLNEFALKFEVIDLLSPDPSALSNLPIFPTSHDEASDGKVQLLCITLS